MFESEIYLARREALRARVGNGLIVFVGAGLSPMNYRDNAYPFVQDGCFNYFFGLHQPDLIGLIDCDSGEERLFGVEGDLMTQVWEGDVEPLASRAARSGIKLVDAPDVARAFVARAQAQGRAIHYPPPYRGRTVVELCDLLDAKPSEVEQGASTPLIDAVVALREIKGTEEIAEMEAALAVTDVMHRTAMAMSRPGVYEREVVAEIERVVRRRDWQLAYPVIFSKRGQILHNHDHSLRLEVGDIVVNDSGAASSMGYASDITRTLPIGGKFSPRQRALYDIVYAAQAAAIEGVRPGTPFVELHKRSMKVLVEGLAAYGVFKGDPGEVVERGAYAIIQQGGLGHQIGLDVHDMEGLGEDRVGYGDNYRRSELFGMNRLRLAKPLKAGMVVTVEPGIYFIPPLIEAWASEGRFADLIDYDALRGFADFGGMRIEDDVLVTDDGHRILGPHIPRTADEVEAAMGD